MVRAKIPGVNTVRKKLRDGTIRKYHYHRATGIALPGEPGSSEFVRAYADAERFVTDRHAGTFNGLVRDYCLSPEYAALRESTRREYGRMLQKAETKFGTMPIAALNDPRVRRVFLEWRDTVAAASGPREGDHRLSVISSMLSWARDRALIDQNHVAGFKRLHHADRADKIWLPEHVAAFNAVAPLELQRALVLAIHTGQRQGDLLRLTWGNYSEGSLRFRQGKGTKGRPGRAMEIPCTAALRAMLDTMPRSQAVILTTKTRRPWQARHFKSEWERASKAAGLGDLHFHDLRGTAVTMLAEAGATVPQIASVTGHSFKSVDAILERYLSRTRVLAGQAICGGPAHSGRYTGAGGKRQQIEIIEHSARVPP